MEKIFSSTNSRWLTLKKRRENARSLLRLRETGDISNHDNLIDSRADERCTQLSAKLNYIRQNPVAAGLCERAEDWPWIIDPFASKGGSASPIGDPPWRKTMRDKSPKAQVSGGKATTPNALTTTRSTFAEMRV